MEEAADLGMDALDALDRHEIAEFESLLEEAPSKDLFGYYNEQILFAAIDLELEDLVAKMLYNGDIIEQTYSFSFDFEATLLEQLAYRGCCKLIDTLREVGYVRRDCERPLHFACLGNQTRTVAKLLRSGEDPNQSYVSATRRSEIYLRNCITEEGELHISDPRPLHLAAAQYWGEDSTDVVKLLLDHGARPTMGMNVRTTKDRMFRLPIQVAAWNNKPAVVGCLLDWGINSQLTAGKDMCPHQTAWAIANCRGFTQVTDTILQKTSVLPKPNKITSYLYH